MICSRQQDDDDDETDLLAVAVNNLAYICRDLGTERFAPFFQSYLEVISNLLSAIPAADEDGGDEMSSLKRIDSVSDAIEVLAAVYGSAFLPALSVLIPAVTPLASSTSGEYFQEPKPSFTPSCSFLTSFRIHRRCCRRHNRFNRFFSRSRCVTRSHPAIEAAVALTRRLQRRPLLLSSCSRSSAPR